MQRSLLNARFIRAWMVSLFGGLAFFLFVHFPGYIEDLGASEVEIGLIVGVTALAAILIRPRIGMEMDRRGRRPVILAGGALNIGVLLLYLTINSLGPWVYVVRVIHGFAEAMLFASIFTYAADILPDDNRTQGLALFGISGMLPIALGGLLGDFILDHSGFQALFKTSVGLAVVAFVLSLSLPEVVEPAGRSGGTSFLAPLRQPDLLPLWWITVVFSLALSAYFTFLRTFVDETGIGTVGGFFAAYSIAAIFLRVATGWLPDRIGPKKVLYPALLLFAAGFVVLAGAGSTSAVLLAGALCGAGHGYAFPILYAMAFARAEQKNRGSASAIFTGLFDVGALIGAPTFGWLIAAFSYETMFLVAAGWIVAGVLVFALWDGDLSRRTTLLAREH
jgi:predicted MFS family arabinose efflux permease